MVLDQLFVEQLDFYLPAEVARRCMQVNKTVADAFREACSLVGLELIDYWSVVFREEPKNHRTLIMGRSKAWCERAKR